MTIPSRFFPDRSACSRLISISSSRGKLAQAGVGDGGRPGVPTTRRSRSAAPSAPPRSGRCDHLVEVEVGDQEAIEDVQSRLDLAQGKRAPRTSTSRRWSRKALSACFRPITPGAPRASSTLILTGKRFSRSDSLKQVFHQGVGRDALRDLGSADDAHVLGRPSRTSPSRAVFLVLDQASQLFDQVGLLHLVRDLADDDPGSRRAPTAPRSRSRAPAPRRGRSHRPRASRRRTRRSPRRSGSPGPSPPSSVQRSWRPAGRAASGRRRSAPRRCAAGSTWPCRPRSPTPRWRAGSESSPAY